MPKVRHQIQGGTGNIFYTRRPLQTVIQPVLKYSSLVWHSSQSKAERRC